MTHSRDSLQHWCQERGGFIIGIHQSCSWPTIQCFRTPSLNLSVASVGNPFTTLTALFHWYSSKLCLIQRFSVVTHSWRCHSTHCWSINNSSPTTTSVHYLLLPPFLTTRYLRVLRRIYMIQWSSMVLPPKWISYWRIRELRLRSLLVWRWHWGFFALMRRLLNVTLVTSLPFFWRIMLLCGTPSKNCDGLSETSAVLSLVIFILTVTQILRQWSKFASGWQSLRKYTCPYEKYTPLLWQ